MSMLLSTYLLALSGLIFAQATPGPNFLAVTATALGQGLRPALFVTLGVAMAALCWCILTALGLAALLKLFPSFIIALRFLGGGYLLYLAFKALRSALFGGDALLKANRELLTDGAALRRGFLTNMTNPKSALWWVALATWFYAQSLSIYAVLGFGPICALSAACVYGLYSLLFSSHVARNFYNRFARAMNIAFALCFGFIGVMLIWDGLKSLV